MRNEKPGTKARKVYDDLHKALYDLPRAARTSARCPLHGFWRVALWGAERALVEFGFPGPRRLRFNEGDWAVVAAASTAISGGEIEFRVQDTEFCKILQRAVDLGYLVPYDLQARC